MEPREYERSFAVEGDHWWFRAKRALVLSLLRRYGGLEGRGVDIGCGTGGMLEALLPGGRGWVGVDAERLALTFCRKRGLPRLVQGSGTALPFRAGAFDACLCLDVLYHRAVASDASALAECHRILKDGGLLVVTDSAFSWLRSAHDDAVHGQRRYTRRDLLERVRAAGFVPLFASYAYCLVFPAVVGFRLARRLVGGRAGGSDVFPLPPVADRVLSGIQAVERTLIALTPLPFGSSVVCVARKTREATR
jgi:SAM-dependent methyltransferase